MEGAISNEIVAQHMRDLKLAIEFKYLMKHAPSGVYLMPQMDDIRQLHGVIFVRNGLYRSGVFRFKMDLQKQYNSVNSYPKIYFITPVFNPLVGSEVRMWAIM